MKKLLRSRNGKIGGVCGGIANSFSFGDFTVDPTWLRILWAISAICGIGIIAYLLCWMIIPLEPKPEK